MMAPSEPSLEYLANSEVFAITPFERPPKHILNFPETPVVVDTSAFQPGIPARMRDLLEHAANTGIAYTVPGVIEEMNRGKKRYHAPSNGFTPKERAAFSLSERILESIAKAENVFDISEQFHSEFQDEQYRALLNRFTPLLAKSMAYKHFLEGMPAIFPLLADIVDSLRTEDSPHAAKKFFIESLHTVVSYLFRMPAADAELSSLSAPTQTASKKLRRYIQDLSSSYLIYFRQGLSSHGLSFPYIYAASSNGYPTERSYLFYQWIKGYTSHLKTIFADLSRTILRCRGITLANAENYIRQSFSRDMRTDQDTVLLSMALPGRTLLVAHDRDVIQYAALSRAYLKKHKA